MMHKLHSKGTESQQKWIHCINFLPQKDNLPSPSLRYSTMATLHTTAQPLWRRPEVLAAAGLAFFHLVGLIGFHTPALKPLFDQLVPLNMLLSLVVLGAFHRTYTFNFIFTITIIYLGCFFAEMLGVNTALIFGYYTYSDALGPKILGTPLMIGVHWLIPAYCAYEMLQKIFYTRWIQITWAALFMVGLDALIEPIAIRLGWWTWYTDASHTTALGHAPFSNYLAWFVIGWVAIFLIDKLRQRKENPVAMPLFITQICFFTAFHLISLLK